ncbi:hypothetical protein SFRURICE_011038 [Spodoptera frugiperda]|nr:hypothetical protein SFRURICE_011038 [Spodoptera frugiperda]
MVIAMTTKYMRDGLTSVMTPELTIILLKPMMCVLRCLLRYGTMVSVLCTECEYMIPSVPRLRQVAMVVMNIIYCRYVIHAMVYQVGIVTNKTDNETANMNSTNDCGLGSLNQTRACGASRSARASKSHQSTTDGAHGNQEAVTFFHTNGSEGLDLSQIPAPLLTNVTAQSMVGVAPVAGNQGNVTNQLPWSTLDQMTNMAPVPSSVAADPGSKTSSRSIRSIAITDADTPLNNFYKSLFKRDLGDKPVAVNSGSAVIPQAAGVQSIAIPPLLTLNNNMSDIPVPIPNTSVLHYSKINTLIRESIKSERPGKNEEDWRRRTIIIEKKNGSYGFTLQSYGIHYKKEQEIEVITYVDHVEGDGPAAAAGMREGDVILSINGTDVERADHAAIVDAINHCDSRMRMVVIFEDCVRKVELHLKYINLQRTLQSKMRELEQLTVRERQMFDCNWKTHSLPSQKKKTSPSDVISDNEENNIGENMNNAYCRPTLSSENVTAAKPPQPSVFMYQYLDPRYGACLIQPNLRTGSFVITVGSPRNRRECHHYVVKTPGQECHRASENYKTSSGKHNKVHRSSHSHGCAPCMPAYNNQDANSLEAYDLASPCCDPHCVPNTRKKMRRKRECSKEHKRKEKCQQVDKSTQKPDSGSHMRPKKVCQSGHCSSRYRYLTTESTQTSQCSLQSYATSNATVACDNSASSYSTSLSSDTLFWDNDRGEAKSSPKIQYQSSHQHVKPKSWDNLTTKAFGGYGFGYGYLDTTTKQSNRSKSHGRNHSSRSTQSHHEYQHAHSQEKHSHRQSAPHHCSVYSRSHSHCPPTKSTESLIMVPKYQLESSGSESRLACDCVESIDYYRRVSTSKSPAEQHSAAYYTQHFIYPTHSYKKKDPNISSEITRL